MLPYWLLFAYFAAGALLVGDNRPSGGRGSTNQLFLILGAIVVALMIGLRYRVGADWTSYEFIFSYARYASLQRMLEIGDPGYMIFDPSWRTVVWDASELDVAAAWTGSPFTEEFFAYGTPAEAARREATAA